MKIGIDSHCLEGNRTGVGRYLSAILNEWKAEKSDHEFLLYFKNEIPKDFSFTEKGFASKLLPKVFGRNSTALFMHKALPDAVLTDRPDIMFFPEYIAPLTLTKPFVLTLHDIVYAARPELHFWPSPLDHILLTQVSKLSAKKASAILTPSEFVKKEIMRIWKVKENKIFVTREAAGEEFKPVKEQEKQQELRLRYDIEDKFFFFVGSAFKRRHVRECMEAFMNIAVQHKNYQFLIAGSDRYGSHNELSGLAQSLNKALKRNAFIRKDFIENKDLPGLYSSAHATIWLSEYEGFGLPPLESLACGTPVITNKAASLPEVVGDCAIFVEDITDIRSIYNAMQKTINDNEKMSELNSCSVTQAEKFSWKVCAAQTLDILIGSSKL